MRAALASFLLLLAPAVLAAELPKSTHNLLLDAKLSGNMATFDKGVRGAPGHVVFDLQRCRFAQPSQWMEYGVGLNETVGVVPEARAAWWMAEWPDPVTAHLIRLSGAYPNQPQPNTAWKIELRQAGKWTVHRRGVGGWYNGKRYTWGGPGAKPLTFDALRVSLFSRDARTPLQNLHFRGEERLSWIVARIPTLDARVHRATRPVREGRPATFRAVPLAGNIKTWAWEFGDGATATGPQVTHTFQTPRVHEVKLSFSDGKETASVLAHVPVKFPIEARIVPLSKPVMAGKPVDLAADTSVGRVARCIWSFSDGALLTGPKVRHTFARPGVYKVKLRVSDAMHYHDCLLLVRAHDAGSLRRPQVHLETDPANGQDDQHAIAYALLSNLDVIAINSVHHGTGEESGSRTEIKKLITLAVHNGGLKQLPFVFAGARQKLAFAESGLWTDTEPEASDASEALLASARGACPKHPVWWVAVGAGTNIASAVLQAHEQGLDLRGRVRIQWMGGSKTGITGQYNGDNDPWSMFVVSQSGIETWIMPDNVAVQVGVNKATDAKLYPAHNLGKRLYQILPADYALPLFDPTAVAAVIGRHANGGWVKKSGCITVAPGTFAWRPSDKPTAVHLVSEIDPAAIKADLFQTLAGKPTPLGGTKPTP